MDKLSENQIEEVFRTYTDRVKEYKNLPQYKINQETLRKFYALYKQAMFGDAPTSIPALSSVESHYKQAAWAGVRGKSKKDAMCEYIVLCETINAAVSY